jgi:HEAT repeat protein
MQGDASRAAQLIASARGTDAAMCALAVRYLDNRFGGWGRVEHIPDATVEEWDLAVWASRQITEPDAVPVLSDALSDRDPCVRRVAARLLGRVAHPRALEAMLDRLGAEDAQTRQMAAIALGYAEKRDAVEPLLRNLVDDAAGVRTASAWALGEIEDPRATEALVRLLSEDPDPKVRRQAAWALGNMN